MMEGDVNRLFTDETTCLFCTIYTILLCYHSPECMSPKHGL